MSQQKKTPKPTKRPPQQRLTKAFKNKLRNSLLEDILNFGGCKAVSTYSLAKFLSEKEVVYGTTDSLKRKAVENYFYYFSRLTNERLLAIKEELVNTHIDSEETDDELVDSNDQDDDKAFGLSPQRLRSPSFTPPRRAAAPELKPRLTKVTFPTMGSNKGKYIRANH
jgi:hypothetical protein